MNLDICALVFVGPLKRLSYQYNYELVLNNLSQNFNHVYLISSSRESNEQTISHLNIKNISVISYKDSWFKTDENNNEIYDFDIVSNNFSIAKEYISKRNHDILSIVDINMYLTNLQAKLFYEYCEQLFNENKLLGYRYRRLQVKNKVSIVNMRHPFIFNMKHKDFYKLKMKPDEIWLDDIKYRAERGEFLDAPYYFCDIFPPILTKKDYYAKYEYYIKYLNLHYSNSDNDKNWFSYILREYNKFRNDRSEDLELDNWSSYVIKKVPKNSIYEYFNLLDGNMFDRIKFKILKLIYDFKIKKKN